MPLNISDINTPGRFLQAGLQDKRPDLKNGEIIRATVVKNLPDGGTMLSVNGKQLNIPQGLNLPEGSSQLFQVAVSGGRIELRPVEAPLKDAGQPANLMPSGPARATLTVLLSDLTLALDQAGLDKETARMVQTLRQMMPSILYGNPKDSNGAWIRANIMAGGMFWENKVAEFLSGRKDSSIRKILEGDLKGVLLSIQKRLASEGASDSEAGVKVKQALDMIQDNQIMNLSTLEDGLGWLFFIPGFEEDGFLNAEIFSKKGGGREGIFFSVLLEFTRLGRFEAGVSMIGRKTSVRIMMDDQERADAVRDNLDLLEKGLKTLGIMDVALSCDVRKGDERDEGMMPVFRRPSQSVDMTI